MTTTEHTEHTLNQAELRELCDYRDIYERESGVRHQFNYEVRDALNNDYIVLGAYNRDVRDTKIWDGDEYGYRVDDNSEWVRLSVTVLDENHEELPYHDEQVRFNQDFLFSIFEK